MHPSFCLRHLALFSVAGLLVFCFAWFFGNLRDPTRVLVTVDDGESFQIDLQHCNCRRSLQRTNQSTQGGRVPFEQTTCSNDAFQRGSHQKVLAFSFYGDTTSELSVAKGYFEGIKGNLELMPTFYPGWIMRLYFDLPKAHPLMADLCQLACSDNNLDLCNVHQLPGTPMTDANQVFPMIWRFFPTLDPQVDLYNSRDLDSRFSDRELAAVQEWLQLGAPIHVMRDNPAHFTPMLGAAWGADLRQEGSREKWRRSWDLILASDEARYGRGAKGPDQVVLASFVWPWAQPSSVQHDSYSCRHFPNSRPFPTQRQLGVNNFVASVVTENMSLTKRCPKDCRPKDHLHWLFC